MTPSEALASVVSLRQADGPSPGLPPFDPEHEALAETSTNALELAALLEAGGITDRRVQEDFGYENVFAYARELFAETERRATIAVRPESDITFTPARSSPTPMVTAVASSVTSPPTWVCATPCSRASAVRSDVPDERAHSSSSGFRSTTSIACRPIEPVAPSSAIRFTGTVCPKGSTPGL